MLPAAADAHGRAVRAGPSIGHLSYPVAGKHLAFDGRLLHGAIHALEMPTNEPPEKWVRMGVAALCATDD